MTKSQLETDIFNYKTPEFFINMKSIPDKNSQERGAFISEEKRKCREGININGIDIVGGLYFHLNYYKLQGDDLITGKKTIMLPRLRDNEWIFFNDYDEAFIKKLIYTFFGLRQGGKSEMISSLCLRELSLFKETEAIALFSRDIDKATFVKKISTAITHGEKFIIIPNIDKDWSKEEIRFGVTLPDNTTDLRGRLYIYNTQEGRKIQTGSGKSPSFMLMDEIAINPFRSVYDVVEPALLSDAGGLRCSPLFTFTGGEAEKAKDAENFVKHPTNKQMTTILDDGRVVGGRFLDGTHRKDCKEITTLSQYLNQKTNTWLDDYEIAVSNKELANKKIDEEIKEAEKSPDKNTVTLKKIFFPRSLEEVFLTENQNHFPLDEIRKHKLNLESYTPEYIDLYRDSNNKVTYRFSDLTPINIFPVKPKDFKDAPLCIYEMPQSDAPMYSYVVGCLPPGEKVMTDKGLINIENVNLDNKLINEKGNYVDIINLQRYLVENEEITTIKVSNTFRKTSFTKEHPILVSNSVVKYVAKKKRKRLDVPQRYREFNFQYEKAGKIKESQWIKVPNVYKKEKSIENLGFCLDNEIRELLDKKDFYWFLGLFYGDGWCESDKRRISFAFNVNEEYYFEKFVNVCKELFDEDVKITRIRTNCIESYINHKKLNLFFSEHLGKYANGKKIPEWLKYANPEFKKELVRGYLNSDGSSSINERGYINIDFVSINLSLIESFQDILFSLGVVSCSKLLRNKGYCKIADNRKISETQNCYSLMLSHYDSLLLLNMLYDEKDHKINKINNLLIKPTKKRKESGCYLSVCQEYIYFKIKSLEKSYYSGTVYNFECDTNTFMCNHITTHNCDPYNEDSSSDKVNSLGAIYVYKRTYNPMGSFQNCIVASWRGRKKEVKQFHELCLMVSEFYNAIGSVLPENEDKTLIQYFFYKKKGHYLADSFDLAKSINPNTKSIRAKGLSASTVNQRHYMNLMYSETKDEHITVDETGQEHIQMGIYRIPDVMLLEEMLQYRGKAASSKGVHDGNYDSIIAFGHCLTLARYFDVKYPISFWKPPQEEDHQEQKQKTVRTPWGNYKQNQSNLFMKQKPKRLGGSGRNMFP